MFDDKTPPELRRVDVDEVDALVERVLDEVDERLILFIRRELLYFRGTRRASDGAALVKALRFINRNELADYVEAFLEKYNGYSHVD
jgi:hypothetical protein